MENFSDKVYYLIGIGGISMSAIAKHLIHLGYTVKGSDLKHNIETINLSSLGAEIFIGHNSINIKKGYIIVYNSAISKDNPELIRAKELKLEIYERADFLSKLLNEFEVSIGISGCHGKTTVTSMIANVLKADGKKFMLHVGGNDKNLGNYYFSGKDIFLSEICEFNKNINKFSVDIGVVLNLGFDHADCYKDMTDIKDTFFNFLDRAKNKIINIDDEYLSNYNANGITSFSIDNKSDFYAQNIRSENGFPCFEIKTPTEIFCIKLKVFGLHNVYNALATVAVCHRLGISIEKIKEGLERFIGISRRFEFIGKLGGANVVCDYAHHPREIEATLECVKEIKKNKLFVIFQPHTYSRTKSLIEEFASAFEGVENLYLYKTYPAREKYDESGSEKKLGEKLKNLKKIFYEKEEIKNHLLGEVREDDLILVLGAGDIYDIFNDIIKAYQ